VQPVELCHEQREPEQHDDAEEEEHLQTPGERVVSVSRLEPTVPQLDEPDGDEHRIRDRRGGQVPAIRAVAHVRVEHHRPGGQGRILHEAGTPVP